MVTTQKLRPCFQAHTICVITNLPLKKVLQKLDASEHLIQWSKELSELDISYFPRTAVKGQAIVDFLLDFAKDSSLIEGDDPHLHEKIWTIHIDGSSKRIVSGAGVAFT